MCVVPSGAYGEEVDNGYYDPHAGTQWLNRHLQSPS